MSFLDEVLARRPKQLDRFLPSSLERPPLRRQPPVSLAFGSLSDSPQILQVQPSLDQALAGLDPAEIPENAGLLGVCDDGLPFLLDFTNPAPGALLLVGDPGSGKTDLLRALLASLSRINTPRQAVFNLIAVQPDEYTDLEIQPHCRLAYPVEHPGVSSLIEELVRTAEERKRTGPQDPALVLVIDDLAALLPFLDEQAFSSLYWLIRHGPRYQIWTLAALSSDQVAQVEPRYLTAFRTRLFGSIQDEHLARRLASDDSLSTRRLQKGRQFLVPYGDLWLRFWICDIARSKTDQILDDFSPDGLEGDEQ